MPCCSWSLKRDVLCAVVDLPVSTPCCQHQQQPRIFGPQWSQNHGSEQVWPLASPNHEATQFSLYVVTQAKSTVSPDVPATLSERLSLSISVRLSLLFCHSDCPKIQQPMILVGNTHTKLISHDLCSQPWLPL